MKSVEDLDVFKLAHQVALKTYSTTKSFPTEEIFSLVDPDAASGRGNGLNGAKRLNGWNNWNGAFQL
ncbi:MAG TPA: four helix bundle protein [Candidatus Binatia bacterium]|nr:four helix bundle protein [Candidatus Binatia bacterium]